MGAGVQGVRVVQGYMVCRVYMGYRDTGVQGKGSIGGAGYVSARGT